MRLFWEFVSRLNPGGLLHAEVPADLFNGIPIDRDPVTHIGFFCRQTLNALLETSGLHVVKSRAHVGTYNERPIHMLWSIGKKLGSAPRPCFEAGLRDARRSLKPGFPRRLTRDFHPRYLWGVWRQHFHYHHPARKFVRRWERRLKERVAHKATA